MMVKHMESNLHLYLIIKNLSSYAIPECFTTSASE